MKIPDLSVVVTTWNNARSIRRCLNSLSGLKVVEIFLCDCGSSDATLEVVIQNHPHVTVLSQGHQLSFAQARNLGLERASASFILFIEGDWCADETSLVELSKILLSDDQIAVAVPVFRDADGKIQIGHNVRRFPTTTALCTELLLLHKLFPHNKATACYRMADFDHQEDKIVDHASGAFILARREVLLHVGGYDENYAPAWMEDLDLSQRLSRLGWKSVFCARATARHIGRETTRHFLIENRYDDFYRGVLRYSHDYLGRSGQTVRICMVLGMLVRIAFSCFLPRLVRMHLLRTYRIYNSDKVIQSYKQMYFRALAVALRGDRGVPPGEPPEALT